MKLFQLNSINVLVLFQFLITLEMVQSTLELVHVIFRHGDRTPSTKELYLKSPFHNESIFAPYGHGQLTNDGKRRCYDMGTALRTRYNFFLNQSYHYTLIEGISSDYVRTKESLQLVLAGLFPPTEELTWMPEMNWIPIATYYNKIDNDKLLNPIDTRKFKQEVDSFRRTDEGKAMAAPYLALIDQVSKIIEQHIDFEKLGYMSRGLQLADELNFTLPEWTKSIFPNPLMETIPVNFAIWFGTTELRRIFGGPLLKKIVEESEMKIKGTQNPAGRKMFLYSGHDFNIAMILTLLDLWDETIPPVGSYCIFEVHNINGTYGFKIFYSNDSSNEPELLNIPGHGGFVPFEEFKSSKRHYLEVDDLYEISASIKLVGSILFVVAFFNLILQL